MSSRECVCVNMGTQGRVPETRTRGYGEAGCESTQMNDLGGLHEAVSQASMSG